MNLWIIAAVFIGVLTIAGVAVVNALPDNQSTLTTSQKTCSSCGNSCTKESNCGLATCGAANGGTCGCGK
jgi:uncharacterized low-complexity protein